jgi:hypothetical protein
MESAHSRIEQKAPKGIRSANEEVRYYAKAETVPYDGGPAKVDHCAGPSIKRSHLHAREAGGPQEARGPDADDPETRGSETAHRAMLIIHRGQSDWLLALVMDDTKGKIFGR